MNFIQRVFVQDEVAWGLFQATWDSFELR